MSRDTCMTCLSVVRDHDNPADLPRQPLGLPQHVTPDGALCPDPRGSFTWNNGHNYWDDDAMAYRACIDGDEPIDVWYGPRRPVDLPEAKVVGR